MKANEGMKTFPSLCLLLAAALAILAPGAQGKWVHKVIKEQEEMPDVFVTKFCFAAEGFRPHAYVMHIGTRARGSGLVQSH